MRRIRHRGLSAVRRGATLLVLSLLVAGCGYRPLYGPAPAGPVQAELAQVRIELIQDRLGQLLRNALIDRLHVAGAASPVYALATSVVQSREEVAIRRNDVATRANLTVAASYVLSDLRTGEVLFTGRSTSISGYDLVRSPFATIAAEDDARERAVQEISLEMANRIAAWFQRPAAPARL